MAPTSAAPRPDHANPAGRQHRRVLIVDDEPDFIEPIAFWLQARGYPVTKARNGIQALEIIKREPPDVVFLDLNMPQMDGVETLQRIRQFDKKLAVIIVTAAYGNQDKLRKVQALGISGFFPKSEGLDKLGQLLQATLSTLRMPGSRAAG